MGTGRQISCTAPRHCGVAHAKRGLLRVRRGELCSHRRQQVSVSAAGGLGPPEPSFFPLALGYGDVDGVRPGLCCSPPFCGGRQGARKCVQRKEPDNGARNVIRLERRMCDASSRHAGAAGIRLPLAGYHGELKAHGAPAWVLVLASSWPRPWGYLTCSASDALVRVCQQNRCPEDRSTRPSSPKARVRGRRQGASRDHGSRVTSPWTWQ